MLILISPVECSAARQACHYLLSSRVLSKWLFYSRFANEKQWGRAEIMISSYVSTWVLNVGTPESHLPGAQRPRFPCTVAHAAPGASHSWHTASRQLGLLSCKTQPTLQRELWAAYSLSSWQRDETYWPPGMIWSVTIIFNCGHVRNWNNARGPIYNRHG